MSGGDGGVSTGARMVKGETDFESFYGVDDWKGGQWLGIVE